MAKIKTRTRAEVYRLWLRALRDGKREQASGGLRAGLGFCCLGVLCDLAAADGGPQWNGDEYMKRDSYLPPAVWKFMGLPRKLQKELAEMNDDEGASFSEIADYIEAKVMPKALGAR